MAHGKKKNKKNNDEKTTISPQKFQSGKGL